MKQFFKFMFASMLGFFLTFIVIFAFFFMMIVGLASLSSKEVAVVQDNSVLYLKFDEQIVERATENPFDNFDFMSFSSQKSYGLNEILQSIKKAKADDKIKGIFLELSTIPAGVASLEEIRNALIDFKSSGKFIYSYSEGYGQGAYYIASISDKIYLNPQGTVDFRGLGGEIMFYKGLLEKLDVEMQVIRHGKFKSAVEPFILDKMSDANREQTMTYLNGIWNHLLKGISDSRKISINDLTSIADSMSIRKADDALKFKFVDKLFYKDEVLAELNTKLGNSGDEKPNFIGLSKYSKAPRKAEKFSKNRIAIIYAVGEIKSGEGDEKTIGSEGISKAIREARLDDNVKAIVLRVNSPGGSALASEIIWREVILAKMAKKPVVVSMSDVAASGGYYIACAADKIVAEPNTITGSIGVFGLVPNMKGFFNNKLGISFDYVKTNKHSDFGSVSRPLSASEKDFYQTDVEYVYQTFIGHVATGRKMTVEQVDSIGQGRVWCGIDAKRIGLVDELGGIDKAIEIAAKLAKLDSYRILNLPKQKDPFAQFMSKLSGEMDDVLLKSQLGDNYHYFEMIQNLSNVKGVQARLPYDIKIN